MENFQQRNYYKLFTGTNESEGHDKIYLGYQAETSEIIFKKDKTTYFHIPYFTNTSNLSSNQLVRAGAIPGPIPAMADRILKKQGNYGNTTPWGTTTDIPDGTWLCSWLYSLTGESPQWLDRFFNPGKITFNEALESVYNRETYIKNDPVFQDVPSTVRLEPGVWYQYFHCGEKTAQEIVTTFAGVSSTSLKLDIQTWSQTPEDESIYKNKALIYNFKEDWALDLNEPEVINRNVLNFKNNNLIDARVLYSETYNSKDEFTVNFWIQNDNWTEAPATQLVGNFNYGGYGIFYNNLKYYPFFVVPETFYGHLYYFNQEGFVYLDKNTQPIVAELTAVGLSSPKQININGEQELLVLDVGGGNSFYKMDHLGDILAVPRLSSGELFRIDGEPKQFTVDRNNNNYFQTTKNLYLFDANLIYVGLSSIPYIENTNFELSGFSYSYDTSSLIQPGTYTTPFAAVTTNGTGVSAIFEIGVNSLSSISFVNIVDGGSFFSIGEVIDISDTVFVDLTGTPVYTNNPSLKLTATTVNYGGKFAYNFNGDLKFEEPCRDIKYDNDNQKWLINNNGILTCNNTPLTGVQNCTNLAIDPENNIWVLYENNLISRIDTSTKSSISTFEIGEPDSFDSKNISFIYTYNRQKNEKEWYSLIYHNQDKTLYLITLDGKIKQTTFLPDRTNPEQSPPNLQDKSQMLFDSKGDFTGYEWKRIFNKVLYNNKPQIQFKITGQKPIRNTPLTTFSVSVPVQYLTNGEWHLITGIFKNRSLSLYIDTRLRDEIILPGNYNVSYLRKNDLFIGTPAGKFDNLNKELNSQALIFDGYIDNLKIYNYAINPNFLNMFVRSQFIGQDMFWNIPTTQIQYIEAIDRFFKHKAPGSKSGFFKIKVAGLGIVDSNTKAIIETAIKTSIEQIKPVYSELIAIEWV